jgi:hypothetical protein
VAATFKGESVLWSSVSLTVSWVRSDRRAHLLRAAELTHLPRENSTALPSTDPRRSRPQAWNCTQPGEVGPRDSELRRSLTSPIRFSELSRSGFAERI